MTAKFSRIRRARCDSSGTTWGSTHQFVKVESSDVAVSGPSHSTQSIQRAGSGPIPVSSRAALVRALSVCGSRFSRRANLRGLSLVRVTGKVIVCGASVVPVTWKGGEMLELILVGGFAEIDEVPIRGRAFDCSDPKAQVVVAWRKGLDDVFCFLPTGGLFRWQGDVLRLVDVGDREERAGLRQRVLQVAAVAGTLLLKSSNPEFCLLFIADAVLRFAGFEKSFGFLMTALEVTVVGASDLDLGVVFDLTALSPGGGLGRGVVLPTPPNQPQMAGGWP